ncbi:MAG: DUF3071 domain-containing protein [Micrococcales bacterium]|nr:DUF3071 domain-containing protein [Micrococcales bacterium]
MQDLRLIGVHEDGQHLLLVDGDGNRFRVPLDEQLRAAARRDRARLGQLQIEIDGGIRPRDIQSLIRAGMTAEEVAERSGWPVEKVQRFEGPVLAEREHVAQLAQAVSLRGRGTSTTLGARVAARLHDRGVEAGHAQWDSTRDEDGHWSITLVFPAGGRERVASWLFDLPARTVAPLNDEARWLGEDDHAGEAGPIPVAHRPAQRDSHVYDVDAEGGVAAPRTDAPAAEAAPVEEAPAAEPEEQHSRPPLDLMSAMREKSGARSRRGSRRRRATPTQLPATPERHDALPIEELATPIDEMPPPPPARGTHPRDLTPAVEPVDEPVVAPQPDSAAGGDESQAERHDTLELDTSVDPFAGPAEDEQQDDEVAAAQGEHGAPEQDEDPVEEAPDSTSADAGARVDTLELSTGDDEVRADLEDEPDGPVEDADEIAVDQDEVEFAVASNRDADDGTGDDEQADAAEATDATGTADGPDAADTTDAADGPEPTETADGPEVPAEAAGAPAEATRPARPARKSGRPGVPSWDDIMFGPGGGAS